MKIGSSGAHDLGAVEDLKIQRMEALTRVSDARVG